MIEIASLVIRLIALIVVLIFSTLVLPPLASWLRDKDLYTTVQRYVQAAEKLASSGQISKSGKKAYVMKRLQAMGVQVDEDIEALIESAVEELDWMTAELLEGTLEVFGETDETESDPTPAPEE